MAKRLASLAVLLLLVIGAVGAYYYWTRTPQYALKRAAAAMEEHDLAEFQKYVDSERLTSRFVDDMLQSITDEAAKEPFGGLAVGMVMMMRPQMAKAAHESLERAVETGNFEASEDGKEAPTDVAKPYWRRASEKESGFRRIAYVRQQGKIAVAGLEIYDATLKTPFTIELKLRDVGSHWQIIEISNVPKVQRAIREATEKRLAELNAPIRAELAQIIQFEHVTGWADSGRWGFDRKSSVSARLRNTSKQAVAEANFVVTFLAGNSIVGRISCVAEDSIEPGGTTNGVWSKDANQFDREDMLLFRSIDSAQAVPELRRVKFADGAVVELKTSVE